MKHPAGVVRPQPDRSRMKDQKRIPKARIRFSAENFAASDLDSAVWETADSIAISRYWSGSEAPESRHARARMIWTEEALFVRFTANQREPLVVADRPSLKTRTQGLWERDVCELFLAPDRVRPQEYYEFEIAPTGEWFDAGIRNQKGERIMDLSYASALEIGARIGRRRVLVSARVGWDYFGMTPEAGDVWSGNLYRIVGKGSRRGYLAWSPTFTERPDFHVPVKFGEFEFVS